MPTFAPRLATVMAQVHKLAGSLRAAFVDNNLLPATVHAAIWLLLLGLMVYTGYAAWRRRLGRPSAFVFGLVGAALVPLVVYDLVYGGTHFAHAPRFARTATSPITLSAVEGIVAPANAAGTNATATDATSYPAVVKADAPVAFYRLSERSGRIAYDSSGHGNNGEYTGSVRLGRPAMLASEPAASAASFAQGYVIEQATWNAQAVTAECWIRPTEADIDGSARIINNAWTDHSGNGFMIWLSSRTAAFNTGWLTTLANEPLQPGHVYYVAGTYNNATGASLYLNGRLVSNAKPGALPVPQRGDSTATYIGVLNTGEQFGHTDFFTGDVSNCAVYDRVLSPAQIAKHYNVGAREHVAPQALATAEPSPAAPPPTPLPRALVYDADKACIDGKLYRNDVLPSGKGEFASAGFDRGWWGRRRGNPLGGNQYSGFQTSWGRVQYDTYFGDPNDGLPGHHDPFYYGQDMQAPGAPRGVRISAVPIPADIAADHAVAGARWYSGVLDTPIEQQYGFFVARVRTPAPRPGMSPAWWMLTNDGTPKGQHGPLNGEWDIQEMFGNDYGNGMNAGTIQWNSGANKPQNWGGTYDWPQSQFTSPSADYHDYGALLAAGGAPILKNDYGAGGPGYVYGKTGEGITNYLDGVPLHGHTGGADVTSGVAWKELMAMFQVAPPGGWLGTPQPADFPAYYWIQWIRVYRPTTAGC